MTKLKLFLLVSIIFSSFIFIIKSPLYSSNFSDSKVTIQNPKINQVQFDDGALTVNQNFILLETAENISTEENINEINIDLGTSRWNVSNVQLNISDMYFKNETKIIEDTHFNYFYEVGPRNQFPIRLAVLVKIPAKTIIYGIYIYGQNTSEESKNIFFQIEGNNPNTGTPNGILVGSPTSLNMSKGTSLGWHLQKFNNPITLPKGDYYIILKADDIGTSPKSKYSWYCNQFSPKYPDLNISTYSYALSSWSPGLSGRPFLYKLIQRVNETFFPEQINMTAEINGKIYSINNGTEISTGNITQNFDGFFPNTNILHFPIKNNISEALIFNLSYYIKLNNNLISYGSVKIQENNDIIWTIEPVLNRFGYNYSVKYLYPDKWKSINVSKNGIDITNSPDVFNISNHLYILNDTITQTSGWQINATSTSLDVNINAPITDFKIGENLGIFIKTPVKLGNYTFFLLDTIGRIKCEEIRIITSFTEFSFDYTIPSDALSGLWIAYISWNNETDAGAKSQALQITGISLIPSSNGDNSDNGKTVTQGIDPLILIIAFMVISIISGSLIITYQIIRTVKKRNEAYRQKLYNKVMNVLNLNHLMIIDKGTGLNIYEESFSGTNIDATLVSGFLEAIRAFGIELTGSQKNTQTISLEYQSSKIIMSEFKNFRIIIIMAEKPTDDFLSDINFLSKDIDIKFGEDIRNFDGSLNKFVDIKYLINKNFNTTFILPLKLIERSEIKHNSNERSIILRAKKIMKENNLDHFFTSFLMPEQTFNAKDVEIIFNLIDKKIFQAIDL